MTISITESGMTFGPFPDAEIFQIENSPLHKAATTGTKTVEFVWYRRGTMIFVEAKSSSPKINTPLSESARKYGDEIAQKYVHSLQMLLSTWMGATPGISPPFPTPTPFPNLVLILVIPKSPPEWLVPLRDYLDPLVQRWLGVWKPKLLVLNQDQAIQNKLAT